MSFPSRYYNKDAVAASSAGGRHREEVGGMWDEIGGLQIEFLKSRGLLPHHTLLDIACGSLRLGVRAVAYLDPGRYWGTDLNESLMTDGYAREIVPAGLATRLPRGNLVTDAEFGFPSCPRKIDFAIAQSLFTHLPPAYLRRCLVNLAAHLTRHCEFYFTVFLPLHEAPLPTDREVTQFKTFPDRDPYCYSRHDIARAADALPWKIEFIGDWGHPRHQQMVRAVFQG